MAEDGEVKGMAEVHKYFCFHCQLYLFGESADRLASILTAHNDKMHPAEFAGWLAFSIVSSHQYSKASGAPPYLNSYTHSKEWGDAKPPDITERDKIMLSKGGVKWE